MESGRYNMSIRNLQAVCAALKVKVHEITKLADV